MNVFVFDIETVPDIEAGKKLYKLPDIEPEKVADVMFADRRSQVGHNFLKLHCHKIVAISVVFRHADQLKVWSLGAEQAGEKEILERFFSGISRYQPTLVSWNGSGFDLPVLNYRAMLHKISAEAYWDLGEHDQGARWNNYISRYHLKHTDLMDILALYQQRAFVPLDEMATMLGYPGKMGMSGSKVWETYLAGDLKAIRDYCETDVLNTYLVYLHFLLLRGQLDRPGFDQEIERVQSFLQQHSEAEHFAEFLDIWLAGAEGEVDWSAQEEVE